MKKYCQKLPLKIISGQFLVHTFLRATQTFLDDLSNILNKHLSNVIIMCDFNIDMKDKSNPNFDKFSEIYNTFSTSNLVKKEAGVSDVHT